VTTAAVVLAAGGGSRFTGPTHKLLAPFRGSTVLGQAVDHALGAGLDETIVVLGSVDVALPGSVTKVWNRGWVEGLATSLRAALEHAAGAGHDAVVVGLGDQPLVPVEAWRAVAACRRSAVCVATYDGRRGNPVRLAAEAWPLLPRTGDAGGRALMASHPDLVTEVPCAGTAGDIDTVGDLHRWS
jgi:CTP:molybdopterin cytidylyltransferase MocA